MRAYNYIKDEYSNKNKLNILIIGNSFGRDIVNIILETASGEEDLVVADLNGDGDINILDIVILVGIILQD